MNVIARAGCTYDRLDEGFQDYGGAIANVGLQPIVGAQFRQWFSRG